MLRIAPACSRLATAATADAGAGEWLISRPLFKIVVLGSIVGLVMATLVILVIWFVEWRRGRVW